MAWRWSKERRVKKFVCCPHFLCRFPFRVLFLFLLVPAAAWGTGVRAAQRPCSPCATAHARHRSLLPPATVRCARPSAAVMLLCWRRSCVLPGCESSFFEPSRTGSRQIPPAATPARSGASVSRGFHVTRVGSIGSDFDDFDNFGQPGNE